DDLWVTPTGALIVVDYKATSTSYEIELDDSEYKTKLKRQIEVYQWLLRRKDFQVEKTGYFIYCNGDDSKNEFNNKLEFSISVLPYEGDDTWLEPTLLQIRTCLERNLCPPSNKDCPFCRYRQAAGKHVQDFSLDPSNA
ncbi:MAG: PD-(D/E)XK nuclease family protein, partial [Verrucomicrobia bacterium]|nr:PD-(D/E)XK nuclease family protein [Verrucomicrobiota bacterium]